MNSITPKHIIRRGGIVLASVATLTGIASAYAVGTNNGAASATPVPEVTVTHRETIIREVPVEVAPVVEAAEVETPAAEVAAEARPAAAPATAAPTATPTRTAPATSAPAASAPATSAPAASAPAASGAVSRDRAIQLAINAAGGGRAVDVSQGSERGIPTWEILVRRSNGSQVEVYVARNNGNIVKVENANDW